MSYYFMEILSGRVVARTDSSANIKPAPMRGGKVIAISEEMYKALGISHNPDDIHGIAEHMQQILKDEDC
jgi:hypothetical protein